MRFKIEMEVLKNKSDGLLPLNYQYEISSWIYKILNEGDPQFADWLHSEGYTDDNKKFKLFTFSNIKVENYKIHNDRLKIISNTVVLYISFYPIQAITPFITGLFNKQEATIGDKISKVKFKVRNIEKQKGPEFSDEMNFSCISPIMISYFDKNTDEKYADYMYPKGERYIELFKNNLAQKYLTFYKKAFDINGQDFKLSVESTPKSRLTLIKAGTPQETKLKSYIYDFKIKAPKELIKLGYYAGFGEKNSLGFGCVKLKTETPSVVSNPDGGLK